MRKLIVSLTALLIAVALSGCIIISKEGSCPCSGPMEEPHHPATQHAGDR
jgi:hypothetical protein